MKVLLFALILPTLANASALSRVEMNTLLLELDTRQKAFGDYKALMYLEQKEQGKEDLLFEAVTYRRDIDDKLLILFTRPKAEAGKGYLRLNQNLFLYDPSIGKWERRTERERIGGTNSRRSDFDRSRLSENFSPTYLGESTLGKFKTHHLRLNAKDKVDVAYPILEVWIDQSSGNLLKQQEYALSGKLIRSSYYPKWAKVSARDKSSSLYYPKEIRSFDELEKGNQTTVVVRKISLEDLDPNIFTKAWLESKSR